jgi:hypothetical protein
MTYELITVKSFSTVISSLLVPIFIHLCTIFPELFERLCSVGNEVPHLDKTTELYSCVVCVCLHTKIIFACSERNGNWLSPSWA